MRVRRIVTGHDDGGRSLVVADDEVEGFDVGGGNAMCPMWRRSDVARFPDGGEEPAQGFAFPPVGGCAIAAYRMAAGGSGALDRFISDALGPWADAHVPGMHRSPTLDFVVVLSGEVVLELDADEVVLRAGDVLVQNGTKHRWNNRSSVDCVLVGINIGAEHASFSDA